MNTEPSKAARRAAEELKQQFAIYCIPQYPTDLSPDPAETDDLAEIIERETGAGEALDFIRRLAEDENDAHSMEFGCSVTNWSARAREFLQRFSQ